MKSIVIILISACLLNAAEVWETSGFEAFRAGRFGNGGQNIYVSRAGWLQRIHHGDIDGDGEIDLLFCNSQGHEEYVRPMVYHDILNDRADCTELRIGGVSSAIAVGDVNGDGFDDVVMACGWDGQCWIPNNMLYYGSKDGISNRYIRYLPVTGGRPAIGDFNGDGIADILFFYGNADKGSITLLPGGVQGFGAEDTHDFNAPEFAQDGNYVGSVMSISDVGGDALLVRMNNGAVAIFRNTSGRLAARPELLLPPDPDFKEVQSRWRNNQFVPEPKPQLRKLQIDGKPHVFCAREKSCALYPFADGRLDVAAGRHFAIRNALTVAGGDARGTGVVDLVFAARDSFEGKECSWFYPATDGGWSEAARIPIFSSRACDALLADFGNGKVSLVLLQGNTETSYDGETLFWPIFTGDANAASVRLPCGDARIVLAPSMGGRRELLIPHTRSGNATSRLPVCIYTGRDGRYEPSRKIELMANGAMDGVFADLDDDGHPDVVLANEVEMSPHLNDGSYIYYNGSGGFPGEPLKLPTDFATGVVVADFNRDGWLDLLFSSLTEELTLYHGGPNRSFRKEKLPLGKGCKTLWLTAADLNLDGFLDIVVPAQSFGKSCILWGGKDGFDYARRQDFNIPTSPNAKVADLNMDGFPDIVFAGSYPSIGKPHDSYVTIFYGGKEGFADHRRTMLPCNDSSALAVADFNNDGLPDLFVGAYDSKLSRELDSHVYWNDSKDGFTRENRSPLRTEAASGVVCGDFDRDGWKDLAIVNHKVNTRHIAYSQVWYNDHGRFSSDNTTRLPTSGPHGMMNVELNNVLDRSAGETYESSVHRLERAASCVSAKIEGIVPKGAAVEIAFRSADSEDELYKRKYVPISLGRAVSVSLPAGTICQYQLTLKAPDGVSTPKVAKVLFEFK